MFQRAGKGKQEQQRRALGPGADAGRAGGDREHEKMHVDGALLQAFPNFLDRKPTAREVSGDKTDQRSGLQVRAMQKITGQTTHAAQNGRRQLRLPFIDVFIDVIRFFKKFDVARDDFRQRQIPPAPEFRRGRTSHARDGGDIALVLDGDPLPLAFGQRRVAGVAVALALQQLAMRGHTLLISPLNAASDGFSETRLVGLAERGHGNFLFRAIDRDGFERWFLLNTSTTERARQSELSGADWIGDALV